MAKTVSSSVCSGVESIKGISRRLHLDAKEVVVWCALYQTYGAGVFDQPLDYDAPMHKKIVEDYLHSGSSLTQTCVKYKIPHRSTLRNWIRHYRQGKPFAMKKKKVTTSETEQDVQARIEQLERDLLFARAENAYLKKVRALMRQTRRQSGK